LSARGVGIEQAAEEIGVTVDGAPVVDAQDGQVDRCR
jgi:hypothetical protein